MDLGLKDKVALVTGGSRGIGRAIAHELADEGCHVAITARGGDDLANTLSEIESRGVRGLTIEVDMSTAEAPVEAVTRTVAKLGAIHVLVNNVGGGFGDPNVEESTDEQWTDSINTNLLAAVRASRSAIPHMKEQGWGRIVHITSIYGREAGGNPAYNASKSAMNSLSKGMARELAAEGILVNALAPGSILFPGGGWEKGIREDPDGMAAFLERDFPMDRFGKPEEIAAVVAFLASERASLVTGACINVDGGQTRTNI